MSLFSRLQKHKLKTATAMVTRPMHIDSPIDYAERSGAAFLPTMESHVMVPLAEALISGIFTGLPAGLFVLCVCVLGNLGWQRGLTAGFVTLLLVTYAVAWWAWHGHLADYKDLLLYREFAEGPEPQQESKQIHEARVKVNHNWTHADLPFDRDNPQALVEFAKGVTLGMAPFSERGALSCGYSVTRFKELRDNFVRGHFAVWQDPKNKKLGLALTRAGMALLRQVAANPSAEDYEPDDEQWGMSPEIVQK